MRVAVFDAELSGRGPGVMLRDIRRETPQALSAARVVAQAKPDILLLLGIDYDHDLHGISAFCQLVAEQGHAMPHQFAAPPNRGVPSGVDLNGDGRVNGPEDAQGFGRFHGEGSMAVVSRWPVATSAVRDFSSLLWKDLPGAQMPVLNRKPFPSRAAQAVQRLSTGGHWIVPVKTPGGPLRLLTLDASPPVFDGPEDRNGLRNADELRLWQQVLDGAFDGVPDGRFVLLGNANLDPDRGDGRRGAIRALLSHPRLQDPEPYDVTGKNVTADWPDPTPGDMRVDYVLPSSGLTVHESGLIWPEGADRSRHALVWVDISF
ncbi:endonuclease/exonuclease/phosphatase family protein [Shimia sp. SDUM112013]|uniref:endonuclease/exonuclease/phosphatase family protein n=1 Tax=Shimia sp. SDUM112013 TaxID=3136160 RepID=UPI0032EF9D37